MGLNVSHDAWYGAYGAFHRWRKALAEAAGGEMTIEGPLSTMVHYTYRTEFFDTPGQEQGFRELMGHSDYDGTISPEMCAKVADALEKLLPSIGEEHAGGHIPSVKWTTRRFIEGCRAAHEANEPLEFG